MSDQVDQKLVSYLVAHKGGATWIAATTSSMTAAPIELASGGQPVMAMGGFNGSDPTPTLEQFKNLVATGKLHYILLSTGGPGGMGGPGGIGSTGGSAQSAISAWSKANGSLVPYGGSAQLYQLK